MAGQTPKNSNSLAFARVGGGLLSRTRIIESNPGVSMAGQQRRVMGNQIGGLLDTPLHLGMLSFTCWTVDASASGLAMPELTAYDPILLHRRCWSASEVVRAERVARREFVLALTAGLLSSRHVWAARTTIPVIGFLHESAPDPAAPYSAAFRQGLSEAGYVEGKDVTIEYHWAEGHYDRLAAFARDFVDRKVDVIAALGGTASGRAAMTATSTIPVVFISGDPLATGLVANLAHPGGNVTGIHILTADLTAKRLELIVELVPRAERIAFLMNQNNQSADRVIREMQEAAAARRLQLLTLKASTDAEIEAAFSSLDQVQASALVVGSDPFLNSRREQLVRFVARHPIPAIYEWREFVAAGGLISYGPNLPAAYRAAGAYVAKILRGASPADLPVEQPTQFVMAINLTTAKALGITLPSMLLARADEVIE